MTDSIARVERWKHSLLDLSASNPLLDADVDHGIAMPGVDALALAAALTAVGAGGAFRVEASVDAGGSDLETGRLRCALSTVELDGRLTALRRIARSRRSASGDHALWLVLGELEWCDLDGGTHTAPLALWPVELARRDGGFEIVPCDRAPRLNTTLAEKLRRDFDVVLAPPLTPTGQLELAALLETAAGLAVTRPGWHVAPTVHLGAFSFAPQMMWDDLAGATDLAANLLVARLAGGTRSEGGLPTKTATDVIAPLDADASQLAAIAAAGAGASFVLHGPPGTGKSQTIANLIVHCATQGKSILFVAEKQAAREAVQARLAAVGLGELCLPLDTPLQSRATGGTTSGALRAATGKLPHVLAQLGRVLDRAFRPGSGAHDSDARLAELRTTLDHYVTSLHDAGPARTFGRSLHEVIGRLVELRTTPCAALAEGDATGLDRAGFDRRKLAVEALARAAVPIEPVATHPWRTSTLERWPLAADDDRDRRARTVVALSEVRLAAEELADAAGEVVGLIPGVVARSAAQLEALGALGALAATSPRPGAELLTQLRPPRTDELGERIALIRARGTGTIEVPRDPAAFLAVAARQRELATEVDDRFTEAIADLDAGVLWSQLKKWTGSVAPLRFVALRAVRAEVRSAALSGELHSDEAMIDALATTIAERACRAALVSAAEPAKRWFGELGGPACSAWEFDLAKIDAAVGWAAELRKAFDALEVNFGDQGRANAWRALVSQVAAGSITADDLAPFARVADAAHRWQSGVRAVADATGIALAGLGPTSEAYPDHLANLIEQATYLEQAIASLRDWVAFHAARRDALAAGVGPAVTALERGDLAAEDIAPAWERATLLAWGDAELADTPALAGFHGAAHHAHVAAFADLDRAALALSRTRALARLAERVPSRRGPDPDGELAMLVEELARPEGDLGRRSVRQLLLAMPRLLGKLAPCIVATTAAVARDLDPELPRFDVVVFDEASQLPAAAAIGAISRGQAMVVVGDHRQLPPNGCTADGGDIESLLDASLAAHLPELQLSTHYRSKHEDLFAIANRTYYADQLAVFPIAHGSPDLGVAWRRVFAETEGAEHNRSEAEAILVELVGRLRDPGQRTRSLAVVTFSRAQQALIEDLLDAARLADPALDALVHELEEPVLVELVDAVQGDDRDVVLVSVGYRPSSATGFASWGALAERGGERRTCVAFTRAREQLVVFSSFAPEDVDTTDAPAGVRDVVAMVAFARAGGEAARSTEDTLPASPITAAIARSLGERGWTVRHQIGCGAYKLDLAVVDPNDPERYVLAIEHDGRAYASAPAARDRDRLRPQMLGQAGWRLHRIWTLDWWSDAEREIQRAHGSIVAAIAATRQRRAPVPVAARPVTTGKFAGGSAPIVRIPPKRVTIPPATLAASLALDATPNAALDGGITLASGSGPAEVLDAASAPVRIRRGAIAIGPYSAAAIPAGRRAPEELFAPRHVAEVGKIIEQVLAAEAPMHVNLLARRVGAYFGIGRLSQRVTDQVKTALEGRGRWGGEEDMVWRLDQDPTMVPAVRVAGGGAEARRTIDEVPLAELAAAARIVVERASGIGSTDLVRDTARLLGFSRITEQVTERVSVGVRLAAQRELIRIDAGKATIVV